MSSRISTIVATVACVAMALLVMGGSGRAASPIADHAKAELIECAHGKQASDRRAVFRGEMTQIAQSGGPGLMQMRFALAERVGDGDWVNLKAPGIGVWREARLGINRFAYRQQVVALQKGTSYRVKVTFRWWSVDGKVMRRVIKRSPVCRQPGKLPNLKVKDSIAVKPGPTEDTRRYTVKVANTSTVTAQRVEAMLLVDGAEVDTRAIGRLNGGVRRNVTFVGPECAARIEGRIDPNATIRETTERDNAVSTVCPAN